MSVFGGLTHGRQKGSQHAFNLRPFEPDVSRNDGIETSIITRRRNVAGGGQEMHPATGRQMETPALEHR